MRRALLLTLLLVLSAPLTIFAAMPAAAQGTEGANETGATGDAAPGDGPDSGDGADGGSGADGYDWRGRLTFPEPVLIARGQTLRVAPGTVIDGAGHVDVEGALVVDGTPEAPVVFRLPVHLSGASVSTLRHARFTGVNATALNVSAGDVVLEDVSFDANGRAIRVADAGRVSVDGGSFSDHAGEAIYAEGSATLEIAGATFTRNGRGLAVYSAARLDISDSRFAVNEQHLVLDLWPWSVAGVYTLQRNEFLAPTPGAAALPAIHLRHDGSLSQDRPRQLVQLEANRIEGAPVGLRAEGRALIVESLDDVFVDNALGVSVQLASVTLRRPTFDNARDFDGTVVLVDPVSTAEGPAAPAPTAGPAGPAAPWAGWPAWGALAILAVVAVGGGIAWRRRRRAPGAGARGRVPPSTAPSAGRASARVAPRPTAAPAHALGAPDAEATAGTAGTGAASGTSGASAAPTVAALSARRPDLATPITSLERRILEDILAHPGTSQRAVADRLGYTRQALHYHVKRLEARGLVDKTIEGRETRCAVPAEVARALSEPGTTQTGSQEKG